MNYRDLEDLWRGGEAVWEEGRDSDVAFAGLEQHVRGLVQCSKVHSWSWLQ